MITQTVCVTVPNHASIDLQRRVRGEYLEMPGMRLSLDQAARLWALDRDVCKQVLDVLVGADFLHRDREDRYLRRCSGY